MQKILRRAEYAHKNAARKAAEKQKLKDHHLQIRDRYQRADIKIAARDDIRLARKERWEHLYRGQLAPRHDVGVRAQSYGTLDLGRARSDRVPRKDRKPCPFFVGDRVVLVGSQYRDRGKIGKVLEIQSQSQTILVEGVQEALLFLPKHVRMMQQSDVPHQMASLPIPYDDCRLVIPRRDKVTGLRSDTIISQIDVRKPSGAERRLGIKKPIRTIAGMPTRTVIGCPPEEQPKQVDTESDTLRLAVEERTWVPTLGIPPMPPCIVDELRHKYSVFRTRFDDEFIARKEAEEAKIADKKKALKIAAESPFDELRRVKREALRQQRIAQLDGSGGSGSDAMRNPLTPEIIEGIARLGLKNAETKGTPLPAKTMKQFQAIQAGFEDDNLPVQVVPEDQVNEDLNEESHSSRDASLDGVSDDITIR